MANTQQVVEIVIAWLFLKSCFQNFYSIIKIVLCKLIINFVDGGLNNAAGFFIFGSLSENEVEFFILPRRAIILFIDGVIISGSFLLTLWRTFLLLLFLNVNRLSFDFGWLFIRQFRTVLEECFFLRQRPGVRRHVIGFLAVEVILIFFDPVDMVGGLVYPVFLLRH